MECVNRTIPTRTRHEWKNANTETISEYHLAYQEVNREKLLEYYRKYHEAKREALRAPGAL